MERFSRVAFFLFAFLLCFLTVTALWDELTETLASDAEPPIFDTNAANLDSINDPDSKHNHVTRRWSRGVSRDVSPDVDQSHVRKKRFTLTKGKSNSKPRSSSRSRTSSSRSRSYSRSSSSRSSNGRSSSRSSSRSRTKEKHLVPEKHLLQIRWPKKGKTVRVAIQENELYKKEVLKLKEKIGGLTEEQKTEILEAHNEYRSKLPGVRGYPISNIPRAQDMQLMVWDKDLEAKAKVHAEACLFAHDTRKERHLDNLIVGQNIAVDTNSDYWKTAVPKWYNQIGICKWDLSGEGEAKRNNQRCSEFSQLVWSNTSRLGCASAWCPEVTDWEYTGFNFVCDYGPEGNIAHTLPYTPSRNRRDICKKCPGHCNNNLCDCGGKVCYNGGTLDIQTCTCSCHDLWGGPTCNIKKCPPTDPEICGLPYPRGYPKDYCDQYQNVKHTCPYMCGVCTGARCGGKKCVNSGKLDLKTCECKCQKIFQGDTCNQLFCPKKDSWFCGTTWDKSYCKRIITAAYECPYMCNVCKTPS